MKYIPRAVKLCSFHRKDLSAASRLSILMVVMLLLFVGVFLSGCQSAGQKHLLTPGSKNYKIYYLENEEKEIVSEDYDPKAADDDCVGLLNEFIKALDQPPKNLTCKKAKPDNVKILKYQFQDTKLTLYFNSEYTTVTGISEVLMRAAIVKTLCQIDGVDAVEFYVNGQPLMETPERAAGFMKEESFIDNTGGETNFFQYAELLLYFASRDGEKLQPITVSVRYDGTISIEQLVVEQLIHGPASIKGVDKSLVGKTVPEDTRINRVSVKEGTCFVDVSAEFLDKVRGITDEVAIYSIVNSLVELSRIDRVEFLVDGEKMATYREKFPFNDAFERNLDLVEE